MELQAASSEGLPLRKAIEDAIEQVHRGLNGDSCSLGAKAVQWVQAGQALIAETEALHPNALRGAASLAISERLVGLERELGLQFNGTMAALLEVVAGEPVPHGHDAEDQWESRRKRMDEALRKIRQRMAGGSGPAERI
jgi:hypothetical protein